MTCPKCSGFLYWGIDQTIDGDYRCLRCANCDMREIDKLKEVKRSHAKWRRQAVVGHVQANLNPFSDNHNRLMYMCMRHKWMPCE